MIVPAILVGVLTLAFVPARTPAKTTAPHQSAHVQPLPERASADNYSAPEVWPVEETEKSDLYSNGLRIENEFTVSNELRKPFPVYAADVGRGKAGETPFEWRTEPAGIVFHSTESHLARFEASEVHSLRRLGRNLLDYVRSQRCYHFVIDRFGRVYRVVRESDVAYHAGRSVWADGRGVYVNLNSSFLSIAFEAQTDAAKPLSDAQIHAARVLTEMLRSRFHIPVRNCVTHAQVSVNPLNMRIGYHTDWASGFPFASLGLPDNYLEAVPSMSLFGFEYDDSFLTAMGGQPWIGVTAAGRSIDQRAKAESIAPTEYRKRLQQRYRKITNALSRMTEENQDET